MSLFSIDPEKCMRDEICVQACPTNVIRMDSPDEMPEPTPDFEEYCLACGHCVAVCPTVAFSLNWLSPGQCKPIHKELVLSEQQTEQFLRSRRSIRSKHPSARSILRRQVREAVTEELDRVLLGPTAGAPLR